MKLFFIFTIFALLAWIVYSNLPDKKPKPAGYIGEEHDALGRPIDDC